LATESAVTVMKKHMKSDQESKIAHLGMVQGAAGAIALYGTMNSSQWVFLAAATLPVVIFWLMDTRYLQIERAYRYLYDCVRKDQNVEAFSMEYRQFLTNVPSFWSLFLSWSVALFYISILIAFVLIYVGTITACNVAKLGIQ
jgi:cellulose synthase/poly-beta-1,6-N-acetylglucosamine synthase-like glycosyltransferase